MADNFGRVKSTRADTFVILVISVLIENLSDKYTIFAVVCARTDRYLIVKYSAARELITGSIACG